MAEAGSNSVVCTKCGLHKRRSSRCWLKINQRANKSPAFSHENPNYWVRSVGLCNMSARVAMSGYTITIPALGSNCGEMDAAPYARGRLVPRAQKMKRHTEGPAMNPSLRTCRMTRLRHADYHRVTCANWHSITAGRRTWCVHLRRHAFRFRTSRGSRVAGLGTERL